MLVVLPEPFTPAIKITVGRSGKFNDGALIQSVA
jgi:hypothetical protein